MRREITLDYHYQLRVSTGEITGFKKRCKKLKRNHAEVMRELITAFNEHRLTVTPTEGQKKEDMYNVN